MAKSLVPTRHILTFIRIVLDELFNPVLGAMTAADVFMYSSSHGNQPEIEYTQFGVNNLASRALHHDLRGAAAVMWP